MPFYLDIQYHPGEWKPYTLLATAIMDKAEENDLEKLMKRFLPITATWDPSTVLVAFLKFLEHNSESQSLRKKARDALEEIEIDYQEQYPSEIRRTIKEEVQEEIEEGFKKKAKKEV